MNVRVFSSRLLLIVGLLAMLLGAVDPLEGSFVILPGCGMVAAGALLDRSRYRILLLSAFISIAWGVGMMVVFSVLGGIGGDSGRSIWWGLLILPYPLGWLVGLVGAVLTLLASFRRP